MGIKMYFKGDSGIKNPVDIDGDEINEGDKLTTDYGDYETYMGFPIAEHRKNEPFYLVKKNDKGGFYAESIEPCKGILAGIGKDNYFFLHDFRFKHCKIFKGGQ